MSSAAQPQPFLAPRDAPPKPGHTLRARASWVLYDFANTIYSAVVVSYFFAPYLKYLFEKETGDGHETVYGVAATVSIVAAGLCVPVLGSLADSTGRAKRSLAWTTAVCLAGMASLSFLPGEYWAIPFLVGAFAISNAAYQMALVPYNTLLDCVAAPKDHGRLSGWGVGIGYLGVMIVLLTYALVLKPAGFDVRWMFASCAGVFLIFALPLFFFVPERAVPNPQRFSWALFRREFGKLGATFRSVRAKPAVFFFIIGNFLCVDALQSTINNFALYLEGHYRIGAASTEVIMLGGVGLVAAAVAWSFIIGRASDAIGGFIPYLVAGLGLFAAILCALAPAAHFSPAALAMEETGLDFSALSEEIDANKSDPHVAGPLERRFEDESAAREHRVSGFLGFGLAKWGIMVFGGLGLAGIWTAGRKILLQLAPPQQVGAYFGLYGVSNKLSVFGTLIFGVLADTQGYRPALGAQLVALTLGLYFIARAWRASLRCR